MSKDDLEARTVFADLGDAGTDPDREEKTEAPTAPPSSRAERAENESLVERTGYAAEGVRVAVLFAHRFGKRLIGERAHLMVKLHEPGVSTEQGAKARQSLVLVPKSKGRVSTTMGWIDVPRCMAELKSYALIAEQHRARTTEEIDIGYDEYEVLLGDLQLFLRTNNITPSIGDVPAISSKSGASSKADVTPAQTGVTLRPKVIGMLVLILCLGVAIGVFLSRKYGTVGDDEEIVDERPQQSEPQPLRRRLVPTR